MTADDESNVTGPSTALGASQTLRLGV